MATDLDGNVFVAGGSVGSLGAVNLGQSDAWLTKYDTDGRQLWIFQFGTKFWESAEDVVIDAAGNVYMTGTTGGSFGGANKGYGDAWAAKFDTDGRLLWKRQLGSDGSDEASGVAIDDAGNVYLSGSTDGALRGTNRGGRDAWLAKYPAQP